MLTILAILLSLNLGVLVGWYSQELIKLVHRFGNREKPKTGVVRTEVVPGSHIQATAGVVRPKSPKEVAREREKEFNDRYQL